MNIRDLLRTAVAGTIMLAGLAIAQLQAAPSLTALAAIEPGQWHLRELDGGADAKSLCVVDPRHLIQLRHPGAHCPRFVVANDMSAATVHYTCPGAGYGRTTIKVETARLFRLETQGIVGGAPFNSVYEARRIGDCAR